MCKTHQQQQQQNKKITSKLVFTYGLFGFTPITILRIYSNDRNRKYRHRIDQHITHRIFEELK